MEKSHPSTPRRRPDRPKINSCAAYRKKRCRYCGAGLGKPFLRLGTMALANSFLRLDERAKEEFVCPLEAVYCPSCHLMQLSHVVPADLMFRHYLYVSSTSKTFQDHFAEYAETVKSLLAGSGRPVAVDIGSNDGLLLSCYQDEGILPIGVDPAKNLCEEASRRGLFSINRYFDAVCVDSILETFGRVDAISANNVFAHIDDIHSVLKNVKRLMKPGGLFVIEFPSMDRMIQNLYFDMIYHEHLSYISLLALEGVLAGYGLEIFRVDEVMSHGGSLRVFIQNQGADRVVSRKTKSMIERERILGYGDEKIFYEFARRVESAKKALSDFIARIKGEGKTVCGYGAPAKANTIINTCGWGAGQIEYIVDDNPLKQGMLAPGSKIPVVGTEALREHPTDYILLFAWNFAAEIMRKISPLKRPDARFIIPLPKPTEAQCRPA